MWLTACQDSQIEAAFAQLAELALGARALRRA